MKISLLNEHEIDRIKEATETILENKGFKVLHEGIRKKAREAGAIVDDKEETVRLPKELLRRLLSGLPSSYKIRTIDGGEYTIGGGEQYIGAIVTDPWIIDYETGAPRRPSLEDLRVNTILTQLNPKVAQVSRMDFPVTDFEGKSSSLRALEMHLLNHTKHYAVYAGSLEGYRQWEEIGDLIAPGGKLKDSGLMTVAVAVVSPMVLTEINAELLLGATGHGFPVIPTVCPMAGTTSPYSKAATFLQGNVENIFIAALTQMLNPGNPFVYAFGPAVSDMHSGKNLYYTFDKTLWRIATVEMAKSYGLPSMKECGGTLTHRYDMQSGAESMLSMMIAQTIGGDLLSGLGSCYNANGLSSEMIVIQSAWLEAAEYLSKGMSFELFDEGVESLNNHTWGGHFLMDDLTLKNLRSGEFFASGLFDMSGEDKGALSMLERAHARVEEATAGFVSPVPGEVQEKLRRYFHDLYAGL